jgi:hypothetical protein
VRLEAGGVVRCHRHSPVSARVGGVSGDMVGYRAYRMHTWWVSYSLGLLVPLLVLLSLLNALTSHLDKEDGGSVVVPGHGVSRVDTCH